MYVTEAEAATKQCRVIPAALIPAGGRLAGAGEQINYGYGNCVGSKCMLWTWSQGPEENGTWQGRCGAASAGGGVGPAQPLASVTSIKPAAA